MYHTYMTKNMSQPVLFKSILANEQEVMSRIDQMADTLIDTYRGQNPLFVCLLRGGAPFAAMLMFAIAKRDPYFQPELDYMTIRTYADERTAKQPVIVTDLSPSTSVNGRPVVILDDTLDTGVTAAFTASHLKEQGATSTALAVLVQKACERPAYPSAEYYGFEGPSDWLTGMGLDDTRIAKEANRWLDCIAIAND